MTHRTRTASLFILSVLLAPMLGMAEDDAINGLPIVAITFDRFDIFDTADPKTDAWFYRYFDPNVFKTRWRLDVVHADLSDGSRDEVVADRPFYSLATRWTWGGARLPGNSDITRRVVAGWEHRQDVYSNWQWENDGAPYPAPKIC